jgi:hypothetical protein
LDRKWISVKDKLPTSSGRFEVTIKSKKRHVEMCNFNKDSEIYIWGNRWNEVKVVAWRERDKPYLGD